jgi:heavy metal efflux system protein
MTRFFDLLQRQRRVILTGFLVVMGLGLALGRQLPAGILPDVVFPRITVIAESGELPGEEVLRSVTRPLEESLHGVPGVREMRSTTSRGSAEINLDCRWRDDMNLALQRVQARISAVRAELPAGTTVEARLMDPVLFPVLGISLVSDTRSPAELRDLAMTVIRPELARLPGVADVVVQGGRRLEARVVLDSGALLAHGLEAGAVAEALRRAGAIQSVGLLEANHELYLGLADSRPRNLDDLGDTPVPLPEGRTVPLRELGKISLEEAPEFTRYAAQGREAVLINVLRQPTGSTIEVADGARGWLRDSSSRLLAGIQPEVFYDQSDLVRSSIGSVRDSLIVGAILAVLVVGLFLLRLRLGLAAAIILPGSIGFTLLGFHLAHQSFNMMTLGGIAAAVGLVLDDAIVVVENLAHSAASGSGKSRSEAMASVLPSLIGSSLCTISIFIPFMALDGVTGAFFRVLALSMVMMLGSSLAICIFVLPLLGRHRDEGARAGLRGPRAFPVVLRGAISRPWVAGVTALVLVLAIVPLKQSLGSGFLPEMDEGSLILDFVLPPGTSLTEAGPMLQRLETEIAAQPEITAWSRRTGDQLGFFITEPNIGDYVLRLRSGARRSSEEIAEDLRQRVETALPAIQIEFGQLVEDVIGDLTTSPQPVEIRLFGEDRLLLQQKARDVAAVVSRVSGVVDVRDGVTVSGPDIMIRPAPGAVRLGLSGEDLAGNVTPAVAGLDAGEIIRGARSWPVRVMLGGAAGTFDPGAHEPGTLAAGSSRPAVKDLRSLRDLPITVAPRQSARLGDLATVQVDPGETEIARDNLRTMVAVTARLSGRDLGSAMREIQREVRRAVPLPRDVSVRYAGQWEEQRSSFRGLTAVLLGAAAAVFLIFLASFRSWRQTGSVFAVVAASLAGVFLALHVGGATFNISSFVGAIMVVGIVSENAYFIVLEHRRAQAAGLAPADAAFGAATRRARPVLMTTAAGIVALAPLALGLSAGSALLSPLALAVVGGFLVSAPLLLLVLPAFLARSGILE